MAYRWHPAGADVDPENPRAWRPCDRCGRVYNLNKLQWQYDYRGSNMLQNIRVLVCDPCYDDPQPQLTPLILSPDPIPVFNARPEPYSLDEASWLLTQDGEIITTQDGTALGTAIPNPQNVAATAHLITKLLLPGGTISVAYLDIFDGDPTAGGTSVLEAITGSATRTDVAADLTTTSGIALNTDTLIVAAESAATVNTNYAAIYDAASDGTLITSGPLWVNGPTVTIGNPVVFDALALSINLNT